MSKGWGIKEMMTFEVLSLKNIFWLLIKLLGYELEVELLTHVKKLEFKKNSRKMSKNKFIMLKIYILNFYRNIVQLIKI